MLHITQTKQSQIRKQDAQTFKYMPEAVNLQYNVDIEKSEVEYANVFFTSFATKSFKRRICANRYFND